MRILPSVAVSLVAGALSVSAAQAATYVIKMSNMGPDHDHTTQFEPQLLKIAPGDSVHFVAVDKGHDVESIPGMLPAGAQGFAGKFNEDLTVTLTQSGVYGYRCKPHAALGMVGLIVVGKPVNEEAAKSVSVPGLAHQVFAKLFQTLDAQQSAEK